MAKGDIYACGVCGMTVECVEGCGCVACDIICCETQMTPKRATKKSKKGKK